MGWRSSESRRLSNASSSSEGLLSKAVGLPRLGSVISTGATAAQAGSEIAANSGRWVKLTEVSAQLVKKYGLMESETPGVSHAMVGQPGSIKSWLQVVKGPGSLLTNPALLAGAAGVMAQVAMQQTMNEITDYLATIDEKVDDVLRAQKDAVLARMIGAGLVIEEAMTAREHGGPSQRGHVVEGAGSAGTIAETQAYALRQLDALAEKLEREDQDRRSRRGGQGCRVQGSGMARRSGSVLPTAGRDRRDRTRPSAGCGSGRPGPPSPRAEGCPAEPAGTHLTDHRAADGSAGCGRLQGQHEGAAAPGPIPRCGAFQQPGRARRW